ncbi:N-acetyltransferase [Granulicatella sp. 19428wC4_WM01]|nr:N-acetyltransferase [Granulicatella sp. 19428wC4_WM01]TFU95919.1 N-acetyltransferase [Granulicatella sp. WM01]
MTEIRKDGNRFIYVDEDNHVLAEITFVYITNQKIDVNHTFVSPILRGKGIGKRLVEAVIDFARQEGLKIMPTCSYVKQVFETSSQYQDVYYQS